MHGWFLIMMHQRERNLWLKQHQKPYDLQKNDSSISDNYMDLTMSLKLKFSEECLYGHFINKLYR